MPDSNTKWRKEYDKIAMKYRLSVWNSEHTKEVGKVVFRRDSARNMCSLWSLEVDEEYRRLGIGKYLTSLCLQMAYSMGNKVWLRVKRNNMEAVPLYTSLGFTFPTPEEGQLLRSKYRDDSYVLICDPTNFTQWTEYI